MSHGVHDAIIVGGSYSGLSAALQLARAKRRILVIDAGERRNRFASSSHGFLTQDGADPAQIARTAREQLMAYPTVEWVDGRAQDARAQDGAFAVEADGRTHTARKLVLAMGVSDTLPDVPGLAERWGSHVFHCPYCHGYELGDGPVGVLAMGAVSMHHALMLPDWAPTTFLINGTFEPDAAQLDALARRGVSVERGRVARIIGGADVELADGRVVALKGLFTAPRTAPVGSIASGLGCETEEGPLGHFIRTGPTKETSVSGVFACGDAARAAGSVALAVGDGAMAGAGAHASMMFGAH